MAGQYYSSSAGSFVDGMRTAMSDRRIAAEHQMLQDMRAEALRHSTAINPTKEQQAGEVLKRYSAMTPSTLSQSEANAISAQQRAGDLVETQGSRRKALGDVYANQSGEAQRAENFGQATQGGRIAATNAQNRSAVRQDSRGAAVYDKQLELDANTFDAKINEVAATLRDQEDMAALKNGSKWIWDGVLSGDAEQIAHAFNEAPDKIGVESGGNAGDSKMVEPRFVELEDGSAVFMALDADTGQEILIDAPSRQALTYKLTDMLKSGIDPAGTFATQRSTAMAIAGEQRDIAGKIAVERAKNGGFKDAKKALDVAKEAAKVLLPDTSNLISLDPASIKSSMSQLEQILSSPESSQSERELAETAIGALDYASRASRSAGATTRSQPSQEMTPAEFARRMRAQGYSDEVIAREGSKIFPNMR